MKTSCETRLSSRGTLSQWSQTGLEPTDRRSAPLWAALPLPAAVVYFLHDRCPHMDSAIYVQPFPSICPSVTALQVNWGSQSSKPKLPPVWSNFMKTRRILNEKKKKHNYMKMVFLECQIGFSTCQANSSRSLNCTDMDYSVEKE